MGLGRTACSDELIAVLVSTGVVHFTHGKIRRFSSGVLSPGAYVDNRRLPSHPKGWRRLLEAAAGQFDSPKKNFDVIASVAGGGVPHGAVLAMWFSVPHFVIRKERKEYGMRSQIDGDLERLPGARVLVVEDMTTELSAVERAANILAQAGAEVTTVFAFETWGFPRFYERAEQLDVHVLCTGEQLVGYHVRKGLITGEYAELLQHWLQHPHDCSWCTEDWSE